MPFSTPPAPETSYKFEARTTFEYGDGEKYLVPPQEGLCDTTCPNRTWRCGVAGLILRAEEEHSETVEVFGVVSGVKDGAETGEAEVWLERIMNPLTDEPHIMFAPEDTPITPDNIFRLLALSPEENAAMHAADFIYGGNCLLAATDQGSNTEQQS